MSGLAANASEPVSVDIWQKVDYELRPVEAQPAAPAPGEESIDWGRLKAYWRTRRPMLDVVATVLWLYALMKVFVADIDTEVIGHAASYRLWFFLAVLAGLVLALRSTWGIVAGLAYVIGFPVVVLFWKLPKVLIERRSVVGFLAAANAVVLLLNDIKRSVLVCVAVAFCTLAIALSHWPPLLWVAGLILTALLVRTVFRTIRQSFEPSMFLRAQQKVIRRIVDSDATKQLILPSDELRGAEVQRFTLEQQSQFTNALGLAVMFQRGMYYWAYQLERYRRSSATLVLTAISYLWLVVRVIAGFALLNIAIYHGDPHAFTYSEAPSIITFVHHTISNLYGSEIAALEARSALAEVMTVLTFAVAGLLVLSLGLSSVLAYRSSRDESEIRETISAMKREGVKLSVLLRDNYNVTVTEAVARLEQLRYVFLGFLRFLASNVPDEFAE